MKGLQPKRARSFPHGSGAETCPGVVGACAGSSHALGISTSRRPLAWGLALLPCRQQREKAEARLSLTMASGLLSESPADPQAGLLSLVPAQTELSSTQVPTSPAAAQMFQTRRTTTSPEAPGQEQTCL